LTEKKIYIYLIGFLGLLVGIILQQYELFEYISNPTEWEIRDKNKWIFRVFYLLFGLLLIEEWNLVGLLNLLMLLIGVLLGQYDQIPNQKNRIVWSIRDKNRWVFYFFYLLFILLLFEEWKRNRFIYPYPEKIQVPVVTSPFITYVGDKEPKMIMTNPEQFFPGPNLFEFPVIIQDPIIEMEIIYQEPTEIRLFNVLPKIKKLFQ
jgi:hypothetical protein